MNLPFALIRRTLDNITVKFKFYGASHHFISKVTKYSLLVT